MKRSDAMKIAQSAASTLLR